MIPFTPDDWGTRRTVQWTHDKFTDLVGIWVELDIRVLGSWST